jgi:predicted dehydrogenase
VSHNRALTDAQLLEDTMMVLIAGGGVIGREYIRILSRIGTPFKVICQTEITARELRETYQCHVFSDGIERHLATTEFTYTHCIIALPINLLSESASWALLSGIKHVLVEKPLSLNKTQAETLSKLAKRKQAHLFIAYNRRFFSSVQHLKAMAVEDDGLTSCNFEFTEWIDKIQWQSKNQELIDNWLIANSSHVIDLAYFLIGEPTEMTSLCLQSRHARGHFPGQLNYTGCGRSEKNILFSYQANWDAPGRWKIECCSENFRYILSPLEELKVIRRNSVKQEEVALDNRLDIEFKPGFFKQVESFLNNSNGLLNIETGLSRMDVYNAMMQGGHYNLDTSQLVKSDK